MSKEEYDKLSPLGKWMTDHPYIILASFLFGMIAMIFAIEFLMQVIRG